MHHRSAHLELLQGAVLVLQRLEAGLNEDLLLRELLVQLDGLSQLIQGGGRLAQGCCIGLEVLVQGM